MIDRPGAPPDDRKAKPTARLMEEPSPAQAVPRGGAMKVDQPTLQAAITAMFRISFTVEFVEQI